MQMPGFPNSPVPAPSAEATEYLRWERFPEFFRPDYSRSLTGITPTVLSLLGRTVAGAATLHAHLPKGSPRRAKKVLLICLDGFGFKELAQSSRLQGMQREYGTWITSVFPSITSTAMTSIYQGLPPSRHGILGHHVWKDSPGGVVDMLRMQVVGAQASLAKAGFDVNSWKREAGLMDAPLAEGMNAVHLMPAHIVGSGLSSYCYGGTRLVGFLEPLEGFAKAARLLSGMDGGWVGLYLSSVDSLAHAFGGDTPPVRMVLRQIEDSLAWMTSTMAPYDLDDTVVMVIADHGQCDVKRKVRLEGETWDWLEAHTRAIGFSGRVMHVYLGPEHTHEEDRVAARLETLCGDAGRVFPFAEARELAGPEPDATPADAAWVRQTLGDYVVILRDEINWDKPKKQEQPFPYGTPLVSHHGALSHAEMVIPVIVAPLAAVRGE
jgi:hypothetical protein